MNISKAVDRCLAPIAGRVLWIGLIVNSAAVISTSTALSSAGVPLVWVWCALQFLWAAQVTMSIALAARERRESIEWLETVAQLQAANRELATQVRKVAQHQVMRDLVKRGQLPGDEAPRHFRN
jgi:hypothetical protein